VILGTAGHIDHGKTALVKALTGVETDRLAEEQRRGITIELGFAPLSLPGIGTVGVVDVPGHEAFVRTMLAGATGIDLALLVIAADESVMPQTREHLAILQLLGIHAGVIALTKADLVDDAWLALVRDDVDAARAGTGLASAPVVAVSAYTGQGMDALRAALGAAARTVPARDGRDLFRLPVDRAFTVRGTGTVVTGTVWTGELRRDDVVRILPGRQTARVRGLQSHGAPIDVAGPGVRAAISLAGVAIADVPRGTTLVTDPAWGSSRVVRADVTLLPHAPALRPRTELRLHLGTHEVGARIGSLAGGLEPGVPTPVRIVLEEPIAARGGDRFVLRAGSPAGTLGGGVITDPLPAHARARPWPRPGATVHERLLLVAHDAGTRGLPLGVVPVRVGLRPGEVGPALRAMADVVEVIGGAIYERQAVRAAADRAAVEVAAHHARAPLEAGAALQSVRGAVGIGPELFDEVIQRLARAGVVEVDHGLVRRAGWSPNPSPAQQEALDTLAAALRAAGREPPTVGELVEAGTIRAEHDVATLLRLLDRRGIVRQVEPDRFYAADTIQSLTDALRRGMAPGREYGPAELRELLGVSRKYLIPLLEYCDRQGVTERRRTGRVYRSVPSEAGAHESAPLDSPFSGA
jgi:selenocysteine-specific elongation factor